MKKKKFNKYTASRIILAVVAFCAIITMLAVITG